MDLNEFVQEQLRGITPAVRHAKEGLGLGLSQAAQTLGADAQAGLGIMNDPRNSWIGTNPVGKLAAGGLGLGSALLGQIVYHGSPHLFEKFAMSKVGTGEGAQAYGHGLYFAENPKVAEGYARQLPQVDFQRKVQEVYGEFDHPNDAIDALKDAGLSAEQMRLVEALQKDDWLGFEYPHQAVKAILSKNAQNWDPSPETLAAAKGVSHLYQVDLPDEAIGRMLQFDIPVSAQPHAQRAVNALLQEYRPMLRPGMQYGKWNIFNTNSGYPVTGLPFFKTEEAAWKAIQDPTGSEALTFLEDFMKPADVSAALNKAGIPGIRYLDAVSRETGKGTYNYVVFDETLPSIKGRQ